MSLSLTIVINKRSVILATKYAQWRSPPSVLKWNFVLQPCEENLKVVCTHQKILVCDVIALAVIMIPLHVQLSTVNEINAVGKDILRTFVKCLQTSRLASTVSTQVSIVKSLNFDLHFILVSRQLFAIPTKLDTGADVTLVSSSEYAAKPIDFPLSEALSLLNLMHLQFKECVVSYEHPCLMQDMPRSLRFT